VFSDFDEVETYVEDIVDSNISQSTYLNIVLEAMDRNDIEFSKHSLKFETNLNKLGKGVDIAVKQLNRFSKFVSNWEEQVLNIVREDWEEDNEGYENFERFLNSKDGSSALAMADDIVREMFEEDEWFDTIQEYLVRDLHKRDIDDRYIKRTISDVIDNIYGEMEEIKDLYGDLKQDIIEEAFREE